MNHIQRAHSSNISSSGVFNELVGLFPPHNQSHLRHIDISCYKQFVIR
jgi:hypothetical protein